MEALLRIVGRDLFARAVGSTPDECRLDGNGLRSRLADWSLRYDVAVDGDRDDDLASIGREMFAALDTGDWASAWAQATGTRRLEVQVDDPNAPLAAALLDAPWELLCGPAGFLVDDAIQPFEVLRRIGRPEASVDPAHGDVRVMFMAAAPEVAHRLDFEAEEAAILKATDRLPLHLAVEESGAAGPLGERLATDEHGFDALHLSCHGDLDPALGPFLALEGPSGGEFVAATPRELVQAIGDCDRTPLVFLSACHTAETSSAAPSAPTASASPAALESFVRNLVRAGVHNVVGWDGSVLDRDAGLFSEHFYRELAALRTVPQAIAAARAALRRRWQASRGRPDEAGSHWHLARLIAGPRGGGALARRGAPKRLSAAAAHRNDFLDKDRQEVPVASRSVFVGRRRPLQRVLRGLEESPAGVLIHGMGNLGKSSLAARVRDRRPELETIVVFHRYDALSILDRLIDRVAPAYRQVLRNRWRESVANDASLLADALEDMLLGAFAQRPILLVIDDLERILDAPQAQQAAAVGVRANARAALAAVLGTFARVASGSRLLLTSRYRFTLVDGRGDDLAAGLRVESLAPLESTDRGEQWRAEAAGAGAALVADAAVTTLAQRVVDAAKGNPGLQSLLTRPLLRGELALVERVLAAWGEFAQDGREPQAAELAALGITGDAQNALLAFFKLMAFDVYRGALTDPQARTLAAASLFTPEMPIPRPAIEAAAAAIGVAAPVDDTERLLSLGLLDDRRGGDLSADPLARPLAPVLSDDDARRATEGAIPALKRAWCDETGEAPTDPRAVEMTRLLIAVPQTDPLLLDSAAVAATRHLESLNAGPLAYQSVLVPAWSGLDAIDWEPSLRLARAAFDCASTLGKTELVDRAIEVMSASIESTSLLPEEFASVCVRLAHQARRAGRPDEAMRRYREAEIAFRDAGMEGGRVTACVGVAELLRDRGQVDEALKILREELLPAFERLSDVSSKAKTMSRVADILHGQGQLNEALRILREEQLPVFERLGDVRSKAVTMGQIADVLQSRGQLDEALRIRRDDVLPVFERLGDVSWKAVTIGKMADVLLYRGQLGEALRILRNEVLPLQEQLGDVRSKAVTMGRIGDILQARGNLDEALRLRREEELPVYEQLGDVRSKASTMSNIADILHARGKFDEALRIRHEEVLPVYEGLGDVRATVIEWSKAALGLAARGHKSDEAEIGRLLRQAHQQAAAMGLSEAEQIASIHKLTFGEPLDNSRAS